MRRLGVGVAMVVASGALAYPDDLPPDYAGNVAAAFCASCHLGALGEGEALLALRGVPETVTAGETYKIGVELSHPELARAGFLLSARGRFLPGEAVAVERDADGTHYATHTADSTTFEGSAAWTVLWQAPGEPGDVLFRLVGNAANGDDSPLGDSIVELTHRVTVRRAP